MTTHNKNEAKWFATIAAWAYPGGTPAQLLADDLRAAGKIADPDDEQPSEQPLGDEWGWLAFADAPNVSGPPEPTGDEEAHLDLFDGGDGDALDEADTEVPSAQHRTVRRGKAKGRSRSWGKRKQPSRNVLVGTAAVSTIVVVALGVGLGMEFGDANEVPTQTDPAAVLADTGTATAASDDECPEDVDGPVTTGNDAGDQTTGPGVIKAFDYAYYVDRSGERARAVATPTGVGTTQALQASIDALPADTTHCLRITDLGNGLHAVQLTENRPGEQPIVYPQLIQTIQAGGKTWIASIKKDPS